MKYYVLTQMIGNVNICRQEILFHISMKYYVLTRMIGNVNVCRQEILFHPIYKNTIFTSTLTYFKTTFYYVTKL